MSTVSDELTILWARYLISLVPDKFAAVPDKFGT